MGELPGSTRSRYCERDRNGEHCEIGKQRNCSMTKIDEAESGDNGIEKDSSVVLVVHPPLYNPWDPYP